MLAEKPILIAAYFGGILHKIPILSNTLNSLNPFNVVEHAKGQAIHDAITSSNADVIINPKFIITEQDFFLYKTVKCEVSGKKGTIKTIK